MMQLRQDEELRQAQEIERVRSAGLSEHISTTEVATR